MVGFCDLLGTPYAPVSKITICQNNRTLIKTHFLDLPPVLPSIPPHTHRAEEGAIKSCNCKKLYYPTSSSVRGGPKNEATATVESHLGL